MVQLIYKKAFLMDGTDVGPELTLDNAYEVICAYSISENGIEDVELMILNDKNEPHAFILNCKEFILTDHFDLIGDYTDVWETR